MQKYKIIHLYKKSSRNRPINLKEEKQQKQTLQDKCVGNLGLSDFQATLI